jgi:hypothetical protein
MADEDDVRRIALALPGTSEAADRFAFYVDARPRARLIAWLWPERVAPNKPRVPRPDVLVVRVANEAEKHALIAADPATFFTEPHYDGYDAVLVRLAAVGVGELEELITESWRRQAPKALVMEFDATR